MTGVQTCALPIYQLLLGVDGIDTFLGGLQDLLDGQLGGFSLPLVGDKLSGAAAAIGDFRNGFVEGFRKTLEDLVKDYPQSEAAVAGRERLTRLR